MESQNSLSLNENQLKEIDRHVRGMALIESDDEETQVGACFLFPNGKIAGEVKANTFVDHHRKGLPRTRPGKYEFMLHAELNLVLKQPPVNHGLKTVYCTLSPCAPCLRIMFQSGVKEVYFKDLHASFKTELADIIVRTEVIGAFTRVLLGE